MSRFLGGSAFTMAKDIAEGFVLVTERTFKGVPAGDVGQLALEIDRLLRELRGENSPKDELPVMQARNRKIQRLNSALNVLRCHRMKARP